MLKFKDNKIVILLIGIIIGLFACQEPYFNTDLNADKKIPVFNAVLTNIDHLNSFKLSYAKPYVNQKQENITGALITIANNNNQEFILEEFAPGEYKLPDGHAPIEPNTTYISSIVLSDGTILNSEAIYLEDTLPFDRIYAKDEDRISLIETQDGNYITKTEFGIFIELVLKPPTTKPKYYRANANYYVHSGRFERTSKISTVYKEFYSIEYEINYDTLFDIYEGFANTNFPIVGELLPNVNYSSLDLTINPLFLPADQRCVNFSRYTSDNFIEWLVPVDLYHTSQEVYDYYKNAEAQLSPSGQIFDPIPEQIIGNMHNETNPKEVVLGLLDISLVNRKYISVFVIDGLGGKFYSSKVLNDTLIQRGKFPRTTNIDTISIDTIPNEAFFQKPLNKKPQAKI